MKWLIFSGLFFISFSFLYSFFNNKKVNIENKAELFYDYSALTIDGEEFKFSDLKGKKVIIVNVASKCGYTPQYVGLQELYDKYGDKVEILGFPSNDFLWQEPGKNSEIKSFCSVNYNVTFPLFDKTSVKKSKDQHPIFSWLSHVELNGNNDKAPSWNFCKYLVDEKGNFVAFYPSTVKPLGEEILSFIND